MAMTYLCIIRLTTTLECKVPPWENKGKDDGPVEQVESVLNYLMADCTVFDMHCTAAPAHAAFVLLVLHCEVHNACSVSPLLAGLFFNPEVHTVQNLAPALFLKSPYSFAPNSPSPVSLPAWHLTQTSYLPSKSLNEKSWSKSLLPLLVNNMEQRQLLEISHHFRSMRLLC
eukprot:GFKZ01006507.1.p1 GENE.GFKZ01006507.1~~GFKZ01006507.1.p1  ORF type:complete len:171 (+),score=4.12 GFKZ01006507.1:153-665(+)